jgi:hypothetical protein
MPLRGKGMDTDVHSSFPRTRKSIPGVVVWIPAFAGMTLIIRNEIVSIRARRKATHPCSSVIQ